MTNRKQTPSLWVNLLSIFVLFLLASLLTGSDGRWALRTPSPNDSSSNSSEIIRGSYSLPSSSRHRRSLMPLDKAIHKLSLSSSEKCRNYILQFLNDTTDEHDECTAFHNAFVAADCPDDQDAATRTNTDDIFILSTVECCDAMERFYLRNCEQPGAAVSTMILGIIGILLLCAIAKALLDYFKANWIPDAGAFILIGAIISGLSELLTEHHDSSLIHDHLYFDEAFFLQVLLPPTIFQAALSIDKPSFGRHLAPILLFAMLGTAISAVSIGFMTHWMTGGYLPMLECQIFGALISSIDPVATLGILSGVGVDPSSTLYALIFGESLLNDAVAIVLFDTLLSHLGDETALDDPSTYQSMAQHFVTVLFGSMAVAMILGICAILFFWILRGRQIAVVEVATFFGWALIPYYVAEAFELSGIIAILAMGFIMDFYILGGGMNGTEGTSSHHDDNRPRTWEEIMCGHGLLSSHCCLHIGFVAHALATTMETIIFAYLGLFLFDDKVYSMGLDQVAVWSCVISRAIMVIFLSWIINLCSKCGRSAGQDGARDRRVVLDRKTQIMLFLAGIRGAVSFALVSKLPVYDVVTQEGTQFKAELKAMTSTAIIFTLFVFGALAYFLVDRPSSADLPETRDDAEAVVHESDVTKPLKTASNDVTPNQQDYGATSPTVL